MQNRHQVKIEDIETVLTNQIVINTPPAMAAAVTIQRQEKNGQGCAQPSVDTDRVGSNDAGKIGKSRTYGPLESFCQRIRHRVDRLGRRVPHWVMVSADKRTRAQR